MDENRVKKALEQMESKLDAVAETGQAAAAAVELDQSKVGRLSRMDALQSQAIAQASERQRQLQRQQIKRARQKLSDGNYGDCEICGEPINPKRLEISPIATTCIDCANT
ncbi:MAG: DnaK suppressor protein [Limisphaerales bacterium]